MMFPFILLSIFSTIFNVGFAQYYNGNHRRMMMNYPSMTQYDMKPNSWGYKIHQPKSIVYHQQYYPKISKSFYESDHFVNHQPRRQYKFDDNDIDVGHGYFVNNDRPRYPIVTTTTYHQHQPKIIVENYGNKKKPIKKIKKKDGDGDSIKINFEIPMMKKIFDKNLGKEIIGHGLGKELGGGGDDHHGGGEHQEGYGGEGHQEEKGYGEGGGDGNHGEYGGGGEEKHGGKDFDIKIPKFDVDGMLDKIKSKI